MDHKQIFEKLKEIAPSIAFETSRSIDTAFEWDGDGPDPADEGQYAYDVLVTATTIVNGELFEGRADLGGCYMSEDEEIADIGGYLPQKLQEAAEELKSELKYEFGLEIENHQITEAIAFLKAEIRHRYEAEQTTKQT